MIVYGIKNCDTMKKAFNWLDLHKISYQFQDYRNPPLPEATLNQLIDKIGLDKLVNKRSTSWRALSESEKAAVMEKESAIAILQAHPTLIKRPVIVTDDQAFVGFSEALYNDLLLK
ncbi:arsenate reductase [Ignatzschineria cameli]|uniref:Arsenate reductase n=1 Tax=Ignatzschineria cameli TaxID=2182793 RepID=A0A2U2ATP0_9GAMM|nr:arsenate reductase [Ignatzschineria cameli]PWD87406.1 arsenate reductase [Ignatzschineria cameli]PWD88101.1 arsenate reductase [Ignatzschineria cameli]PWD91132.1 arsenate reductase [Ignatzschineria cameli]PWD92773.1 arsenate reductase [Ignatzschineria cameli]PWD93794.1 arsenate reductase [Ignatzschineria cameli]